MRVRLSSDGRLNVGIVQCDNALGLSQVVHNRDRNNRLVRGLFAAGAALVVLPELSNQQYFMHSLAETEVFSEPLSGDSVSEWCEISRESGGYVVGSILEQDHGRFYNTSVVTGPEGVVGKYRKTHLFAWEREYLTPGDLGYPLLPLFDGSVKLGLLICYDLRFPEAVRSIALAGADLLVVPTTWTSIGKPVLWDPCGYCTANHLAIGHAYSNRLPVVCADRSGTEDGVRYMGASLVVDSYGTVVAGPASGEHEQTLLAGVDPLQARDKRVGASNDLAADRRPELYRL